MMKQLLILLAFFANFILAMAQGDVDTRIAVNDGGNANTFVVVIANENYKYEHVVPFALNDGETFKLYCEKTLGIPQKNIRYAGDATLNDMRMQVQWLKKVMRAYGGEAHAIVYYSGHGMPDDATRQAYLLPVDGNSTMPGSGLSTAWLYKELGEMPSAGTLVLLDACFSGAQRDGQMLAAQSKGVAIKPKDDVVGGNMVVFSAAQAGETAYPYMEKRHGLFTYYLLELLQEKGGYVSLGELSDYVSSEVGKTSIVENDKSQTPTLLASANVPDWRKWVLTHKKANKYEKVVRNTPITQIAPTLVDVSPKPIENRPITPRQTPQGQVFTVEGVSFTMIPVKSGTFMMGATDEQGSEAESDENPAHQVTLSDFYIGETEVTQELWEAVMGSNPSRFKGAKRPVEQVSWDDCQGFIQELNALTGQHFRLPTEAEWEFAARGGNNDIVSKYAGSSAIDRVAWYDGNSGNKTHDVKTKKANELGLYDMSGNVWEWCNDWKGSYSSSAQTNPTGPSSGSNRVSRGGSWYSNARGCRVSYRNSDCPSFRYADLGLRLAL